MTRFFTLLLLFSIGCGGATSSSPSITESQPKLAVAKQTEDAPKAEADAPPVEVEGPELWNAYREAIATADAKYTGKRVRVTVSVMANSVVKDDSTGTYAIGLDATVGSKTYPPGTLFHLRNSETDKVAKLEPNKYTTVRIVGKVRGSKNDGKYRGIPNSTIRVDVDDCTLEIAEPKKK